IIFMARVPDDIPRLAGIINAEPTTPLSHTNVLAFGWQIPNAIQLGIYDRIAADQLDGEWVRYRVGLDATEVSLERIEAPIGGPQRPTWLVHQIRLEEPEVGRTAINDLDELRITDRYRYGTKAANLGELRYVLDHGSERMLGFYNVKRPPRENLRPFAAQFLGLPENAAPDAISQAAWRFLREKVKVPRGIAIPFSIQQEFLESSPAIQQGIGKLKMALELNARQIDVLCLDLQEMIRRTRLPERIRRYIDNRVAFCLSGVESFVVRSSSNAEDLENFSAAGIYESINHVTTADRIFESIREVWISLLSPRSVRLRHEVGISLDHCYMGVILQEEVRADLGGVMVTTNPTNPQGDFRNVYINATRKSVENVVQGSEAPIQCLFNTVEGGGRTLSLGSAEHDLSASEKAQLQQLAFVGRLLQSHFSPDYTFRRPVDIEWLINEEGIHILQLRPYSQ
ncbi:MAG TPA: PEP/pyruvate-binding domain-containing protein, partial [Oscillatoriaceae cyanobacterium]